MSGIPVVTLPQPSERDIEVIRLVENISHKLYHVNKSRPVNHSSVLSEMPASETEQLDSGEIEQDVIKMLAWMITSQDILHYAFPILFLLGLILTLLSVVGLAKQMKLAHDVFLIGFTIAAALLITCGVMLHLQDYMTHSNTYQSLYGYIKSLNDWFSLSSLWILVIMSMERAISTVKHRVICSTLQAGLVVGLIYSICLISTLPQLWQFETTETFDYALNQSLVMSQLNSLASAPVYSVVYLWYNVTVTVIVPYPLIITAFSILIRYKRRSRSCKLRQTDELNTSQKKSRRKSQSGNRTRLFIVLLLLYIILTGPLTFLNLINGTTPSWAWPQDQVITAVHPILEFVFYSFYASVFVLLCSYHDSFRNVLVRTFCCCCCRRQRRKPIRQYKNR